MHRFVLKNFLHLCVGGAGTAALLLNFLWTAQPTMAAGMTGTYRCWSYNVEGAFGTCRLVPALVFGSDGRYTMSSEKGKYVVKDDLITLSKSKLRGAGKIVEGNKIRFEYEYKGQRHTVTYLREAKKVKAGPEIIVELTLLYPRVEGWFGYINTVVLVPKGQNIDKALYQPTAIAVYDGEQKITASFFKQTNKVRSGAEYDVYTGSGAENVLVGSLDVRKAKGALKKTIRVVLPAPVEAAPSASAPASVSELVPTPSPSPTSAPTPTAAAEPINITPCRPDVPRYAQPGCRD